MTIKTGEMAAENSQYQIYASNKVIKNVTPNF